MMKISSYALTVALLTHEGRRAAAQTCEGVISSFTGECNYANFIGGLNPSCDAAELLPGPLTAADGCPTSGDAPAATCSDPLEKHAFGCCAGTQNVDLTCTRPGCVQDEFLNFFEAKAHCEAEGLRLCTAAELGAGACCAQGCSFDNELNWTADSCGAGSDPEAEVAELCAYDAPAQFVEMNQYYQGDRMFFAGGGKLAWEADYAQVSASLDRFATNAGDKTIIAYPDYYARVKYNQQNGLGDNGQPPNLNIDTQCDQNTIMCCYTDDSKSDAFPDGQTTDVCYNDLANNREANFITNGWSVFPGSETSTYCLGFTWSEANQDSDLLGNAMYGISYRTVETKGYLGAIPGAPLCGCAENMPVVEKADCLTASVNGDVTYKFTLEADGAVSAANEATIDYTSCGDLKAASEAAGNADIGSYLVGDGGCAAATGDFLNEEELSSLGTSERSVAVDHAVWSELFVGEGTFFQPPGLDRSALDVEFRALVDAGCWDETDANGARITRPCIVRRECNGCSQPSHRHIYYRRHTAIPPAADFNFVDYFMNQFTYESPNMHGEDFDLYSTYEDALNGTNAWEYCNDRNYWGIGFPYECGPNKKVYNQYNSYEARRHWGHANHHGYFVELVKAL